MGKSGVTVTVRPGKGSGRRVATAQLRVSTTGGAARATGKPGAKMHVQIHAHFKNKSGQQRARTR